MFTTTCFTPAARLTAARLIAARLTAAAAMLWLITDTMAAPPPPDSGALLQQNQPPKLPAPANNGTGLTLESPKDSNLPDSTPFMIKHLDISGNTLFDNATLQALLSDIEGQEHTINELRTAVDRISEYYHAHGYPLSRAYVPAQTIEDGLVKIFVIEARYGDIHLNNASRVNDEVIASTLSVLQPQHFVEQTKLDRALLLLSDMPGLTSNATLEPGQSVGTSDLNVEIQATPAWTGSTTADNNGNAYTGRARLTGTFNWINPLHQADVLSASLTSAGRNMNSGSLTYETLVSGAGDRVGALASDLHYRLGDALSSLQASGTAMSASLWWRHPWLRSVELNLNSQVQLDYKNLKDDINSTGIYTNRHLDVGELTLRGDALSPFLAGAQTSFSAVLRVGHESFDNAAAQALDQRSAGTEGRFVKFNLNYNRVQNFSPTTALYMALSTQRANGNLDSSEKMVAGGAYSVRAYDMGSLSGDSGALGTLELRHNLTPWWGGSWQAVAFADNQYIRINQDPWAVGPNAAYLHGVGLGLNWANETGWHFKLYGAAPTGSVPDLLKINKSVRIWAEIGTWF